MSETQPNTQAETPGQTQGQAPAAAPTSAAPATFNVRLVIALLLPLVALVLLIVRAELGQKKGKRWTVAIGGYDPRDLIRGHYLQYRVRWKKDPISSEACTDRDGDCYLCLRRLPGDTGSRPEPLVQWVRGSEKQDCDSGAKSRWAKDRSFHSGCGGLASTLHDYHRFCLMLLGGGKLGDVRIVSRKTLALMTANHLPGGGDLTQHSVGIFSEDENAGVGFGLGFAVTLDPARAGIPGSAGDFYWGGMFSTGFFVDPVEEICMVFMTQLMPSSTYPVRREVKTLVHAAIDD